MDKEIEGADVAAGAVGSEGEQRSSTLSPARDDESVAPLAPGQRWSLARKRDVVLRLMQGEPVEALSRRLGCRSTGSRSGGNGALRGSTPGCASATAIQGRRPWPRRIGASAS